MRGVACSGPGPVRGFCVPVMRSTCVGNLCALPVRSICAANLGGPAIIVRRHGVSYRPVAGNRMNGVTGIAGDQIGNQVAIKGAVS